jgi:hypothetical protein
MVAEIAERTDGVPVFVEGRTKAVLEEHQRRGREARCHPKAEAGRAQGRRLADQHSEN